MLKKIISLYLYILIQFERVLDHSYRLITGLPTLKRSLITPNLILGGQYKVTRLKTLKQLGVTGIVNMRAEAMPQNIKDLGINILYLPTADKTAPKLSFLKKGTNFIDQQIKNGGKVYIHCKWGEERGPTMAIAYLIYTGLTFEDALDLVKGVRRFINPTKSQITRLKEFEALTVSPLT